MECVNTMTNAATPTRRDPAPRAASTLKQGQHQSVLAHHHNLNALSCELSAGQKKRKLERLKRKE